MSPLVKTKRQANLKDFKRFGAFKGLVEQKNIVLNSFVCQLGFFGTRGPLKRSFHWRFKLAHSLTIFIVKTVKKKVKTSKENFTKIRNQVTSASGQLECLIVL
jgi:hypothetical protein